jgi:hypothetical protein
MCLDVADWPNLASNPDDRHVETVVQAVLCESDVVSSFLCDVGEPPVNPSPDVVYEEVDRVTQAVLSNFTKHHSGSGAIRSDTPYARFMKAAHSLVMNAIAAASTKAKDKPPATSTSTSTFSKKTSKKSNTQSMSKKGTKSSK